MTDVLYFGNDTTAPISESYFPSVCILNEKSIQRVLFIDRKKLEDRFKNPEDASNWQLIANVIKTERDSILTKEKFYSVSCGPKYTILTNSIVYSTLTEGHLWGFGHTSRKSLFAGGLNNILIGLKFKDSAPSGNIPIKVSLPEDQRFIQVECGDSHFIGVSTRQTIFGWGDYSQGRLVVNGDPTDPQILSAKPINLEVFAKVMDADSNSHFKKAYFTPEASQIPFDNKFLRLESLSCGPENSYFVVNSRVFVAGKGNLGVGATNIISHEYLQETGHTPYILYSLFRYKVKGVAVGKTHALAWDVEGFIYSWGDPEYGKLGHPVDSETLFEKEILPKRIKSLENERIVQAACGYRHSIALTNTGNIYMWGNFETSDQGLAGRESTLSFINIRPRKLDSQPSPADSSIVFVKITAGAYHNAAIDKNGCLYTWGDCSSGCLGHEKMNDRTVPTLVVALKNKKAIDVACGEKFTVVIIANKDAKITSKCVHEFTKNSIRTFQERLNVINSFNSKKKKFKIERKKKELAYTPTDEIKIPITQMSQKQITDHLTQYYVQKSVETNPKNREKLDLKMAYFGRNIEDIAEASNSGFSDRCKDSSSFIRPPSLTKLDQEQEDQKEIAAPRKPKRGLTVSPGFKFSPKKDVITPGNEPPKTAVNTKKTFFPSPVPVAKKPEGKRPHGGSQLTLNISYVFDSVTEHLNEKSDYYHEFNALMTPKPYEEPFEQLSNRLIDMNRPKTAKQLENDLNKKSHVRDSEFVHIASLKGSLRPQTAKTSSIRAMELSNSKMIGFTINTDHMQIATPVRPSSSYSVKNAPTKTKTKSNEGMSSFDALKMIEAQKRHEQAEMRNRQIVARKNQHINEMAAERNFKIKMVQEKKATIQLEKKHKIADMTYKRSYEFKNLMVHMRERKAYIENLQRELIGFIGGGYLVHALKSIIDQYRENKQYMICRNMKATHIQKAWRKYLILKRMKSLNPKQLNIIKLMIIKYVNKRKRQLKIKRVRKIYLLFFYYNLSKKIAQKLLAIRNIIIPIQRFIQWSRRVFRLRFRRLTLAWDLNMIKLTNIKIEDSKLLSSASAKPLEFNSPTKASTKVEANLIKQKKIVEMELNNLGLNKKDKAKGAGDIKTKFEVILDHMKLRGAMLSLENEEAIKQQQQQMQTQQTTSPLKTMTDSKSMIMSKLEAIPSFESIIRETILPYSVQDAEITFATQYTVKKDLESIHERILPKLVQFECHLKTKIIREIYEKRVISYNQALKEYEKQLRDFMIKHRKDIDLERTKMMLKTPKDTLRAISRKEETEFKMENANTNKRKAGTQVGLGEKDHLPFAKLKVKIAAAMPNAPKFPSFKTTISFEEFKIEFKKYHEEYKIGYAKLVQFARSKGRNYYEG